MCHFMREAPQWLVVMVKRWRRPLSSPASDCSLQVLLLVPEHPFPRYAVLALKMYSGCSVMDQRIRSEAWREVQACGLRWEEDEQEQQSEEQQLYVYRGEVTRTSKCSRTLLFFDLLIHRRQDDHASVGRKVGRRVGRQMQMVPVGG